MATNQLTNAPTGAVLEVSAPPRVAVSGLSGRLARNLEPVAAFFLYALAGFGWAGWEYADGVGLRIHNPQPGTTFYRAGLRDNDVILLVDGRNIEKPQEFLRRVETEPPGKPMQLRVVHGGGIEIMKDAVPINVSVDAMRNVSGLGMQVETDRPALAPAFYSHYVTYAAVV